MQLSKDCARSLKVNIMIFRKQVKNIKALYSCGYEGDAPPSGPVSATCGKPRLAPRLAPRLFPRTLPADRRRNDSEGLLPARRQGGDADGDEFPPVLLAAVVPPEVPWSLIAAVPGSLLSGKFGAEEKLGFLSDRFR